MQEERQRGKDRSESEVESTSSANEDMPVEKILEAELAVEPKTETYVEANMGLNPSSVSAAARPGLREGPWAPANAPGEDPSAGPPRVQPGLGAAFPIPGIRAGTLPLTFMLHGVSGLSSSG